MKTSGQKARRRVLWVVFIVGLVGFCAYAKSEGEKKTKAKIETLKEELKEAVADERWFDAEPLYETLVDLQKSEEGLEEIRVNIEENLRQKRVQLGLKLGVGVVSDSAKCQSVTAVQDIWERVKQVKPTDEKYMDVVALTEKLERCRKRALKKLPKEARSLRAELRKTFAKEAENNFLDMGFDVRISLQGKSKDKISIEHMSLTRLILRDLEKDKEFFPKLERYGFRQVTFSDGFRESWQYDLNPVSGEEYYKKEVKLLDEPLTLK